MVLSGVGLILLITYTVLAFVLYHRVFDVIYFGGAISSIFKELIICILFGVLMTMLTLYYWKIVLAVVIVAGIGLIITADSTEKRVAFIVLLVIVGIVITVAGTNYRKITDKKNASNSAKQEQQYEKVKKEVDNNSGDNEDSDMDESDDSEDMEDSDMEDPENLDEGESTDYILPDSDSQYITDDDLYDLSESECKIARNEIYARHGRKFNDTSLQEYFDSKDWYEGTIEPEEFDESVLNKYEKKNVKTIAKYETE